MMRAVVVGTSGSGKSTFADEFASRTKAPHVELDALHWRDGWQEAPDEEFLDRVRQAVAQDRWIIDGNYTSVGAQDLILPRAELVVWLDMPRLLTWWRVAKRSAERAWTKKTLWATNNTESLRRSFLSTDSVILWSIRTHGRNRRKYAEVFLEPSWEGQRMVRIRNEHERQVLLAEFPG